MTQEERRPATDGAAPEAVSTTAKPSVQRRYDHRGHLVRRWARLSLDDLLDVEHPTPAQPLCDGRHHRGQSCDWWGCCTSMSAGIPERAARGRELVRSGWSA